MNNKFRAIIIIFIMFIAIECMNATTLKSNDNELVANKKWHFVVFGDTRDLNKSTTTGISKSLNFLAKQIASEKPDLVLHVGDLTNGFFTDKNSTIHGKYCKMFDNWKLAVKPIYDFENKKGIPLYAVRGNHEDGSYITNKKLKYSYLASIAPYMPKNGPDKEEGLTYSVKHKQATFIALDEYSIKKYKYVRGLIDQEWLDDQLARTKTPFTFVFGHVPAYKIANEESGPFPDLYFFKKHRDNFWNSLKKANVQMYFCGHVHLYCRVTKDCIQQVLIGNGGANPVEFKTSEVDPNVTLNYPLEDITLDKSEVSYILFTFNNDNNKSLTGVQKTWNAKKNIWEEKDSFTVQVSSNNCAP